MRILEIATFLLLVVGGLNWLLVGLFQFDFVAALLGGQASPASRIVYILVGISAVVQLLRAPQLFEARRTGDRP